MIKVLSGFRKGAAFLIMLCMILSVVPMSAFAAPVSDISGNWAQATIQSWIDKGLINGFPDGTFRPNSNISRAEFISLINRVYGFTVTAPITFPDVKAGSWYYKDIEIAKAAGYITGYPDGMMKPENPISRGEVASVVMKINMMAPNSGAAGVFTDSAKLTWNKGAIGAVLAANIMKGFIDGSFNPQKYISRAEATVALDRSYQYALSANAGQAAPSGLTGVMPTRGGGSDGMIMGVTSAMEYKSAAHPQDPYTPITNIQITGLLPGAYNVRYSAKPGFNAGADQTVNIQVRPNLLIQLIGMNPASVTLGATAYADPGAVADDLTDGNITAKIVVTGHVDTATLGTYTLTYTITDSAMKTASVTRTVNVVDTLDPTTIQQFVSPLLIPWTMPKSSGTDPNVDYYEIAMKQFAQQMLPPGMPKTTVWGYGSVTDPNAVFNAPSLNIEAQANRPVRIKWINDLIDTNGNYLPPLLPIDQTLHWANPAAGPGNTDSHGTSGTSYVGPVPIVTHVHGAHVYQESDGFPEAWYLPAANHIPSTYAMVGSLFNTYKATAQSGNLWQAGRQRRI